MSEVRTNAAATMLGVSANTLRGWEQRFGHPTPRRTEGGHRIFELAEIEALRDALRETGDIGAAIAIVLQRGEGPSTPQRLRLAFSEFSEAKADRLLEESLLTRSLERTVENVLLAAIELLDEDTPERCFALRYATGWLAAAKRIAPLAFRKESVMVFDMSPEGSLHALYVQAFELVLRRCGLHTLSLPVSMRLERVGNALRALRPDALVLAGAGAKPTEVVQLVHCARQVCGEVRVYDFRGAVSHTGASTMLQLGEMPVEAVRALRERLEQPAEYRLAALGSAFGAWA